MAVGMQDSRVCSSFFCAILPHFGVAFKLKINFSARVPMKPKRIIRFSLSDELVFPPRCWNLWSMRCLLSINFWLEIEHRAHIDGVSVAVCFHIAGSERKCSFKSWKKIILWCWYMYIAEFENWKMKSTKKTRISKMYHKFLNCTENLWNVPRSSESFLEFL